MKVRVKKSKRTGKGSPPNSQPPTPDEGEEDQTQESGEQGKEAQAEEKGEDPEEDEQPEEEEKEEDPEIDGDLAEEGTEGRHACQKPIVARRGRAAQEASSTPASSSVLKKPSAKRTMPASFVPDEEAKIQKLKDGWQKSAEANTVRKEELGKFIEDENRFVDWSVVCGRPVASDATATTEPAESAAPEAAAGNAETQQEPAKDAAMSGSEEDAQKEASQPVSEESLGAETDAYGGDASSFGWQSAPLFVDDDIPCGQPQPPTPPWTETDPNTTDLNEDRMSLQLAIEDQNDANEQTQPALLEAPCVAWQTAPLPASQGSCFRASQDSRASAVSCKSDLDDAAIQHSLRALGCLEQNELPAIFEIADDEFEGVLARAGDFSADMSFEEAVEMAALEHQCSQPSPQLGPGSPARHAESSSPSPPMSPQSPPKSSPKSPPKSSPKSPPKSPPKSAPKAAPKVPPQFPVPQPPPARVAQPADQTAAGPVASGGDGIAGAVDMAAFLALSPSTGSRQQPEPHSAEQDLEGETEDQGLDSSARGLPASSTSPEDRALYMRFLRGGKKRSDPKDATNFTTGEMQRMWKHDRNALFHKFKRAGGRNWEQLELYEVTRTQTETEESNEGFETMTLSDLTTRYNAQSAQNIINNLIHNHPDHVFPNPQAPEDLACAHFKVWGGMRWAKTGQISLAKRHTVQTLVKRDGAGAPPMPSLPRPPPGKSGFVAASLPAPSGSNQKHISCLRAAMAKVVNASTAVPSKESSLASSKPPSAWKRGPPGKPTQPSPPPLKNAGGAFGASVQESSEGHGDDVVAKGKHKQKAKTKAKPAKALPNGARARAVILAEQCLRESNDINGVLLKLKGVPFVDLCVKVLTDQKQFLQEMYAVLNEKIENGDNRDIDYASSVDAIQGRREQHQEALRFAKSSIREKERKAKQAGQTIDM